MKWLDHLAFTDGHTESRLLKTKMLYFCGEKFLILLDCLCKFATIMACVKN